MSNLTNQQVKQIDDVLNTLKMALPSSRSSWPYDLRKQDTYDRMGKQVIAWNGTCGANATIGIIGYPMVKNIKNTPKNNVSHKWIYMALQNKKYLDEKDRDQYTISYLEEKAERGPWTELGKRRDIFRTEDISLMVTLAKKAKSNQATIVAITEVQTNGIPYDMYTFYISPAICFHILAVPEKETI